MLALAWSAGVFAIYMANGREIWSGNELTRCIVVSKGYRALFATAQDQVVQVQYPP